SPSGLPLWRLRRPYLSARSPSLGLKPEARGSVVVALLSIASPVRCGQISRIGSQFREARAWLDVINGERFGIGRVERVVDRLAADEAGEAACANLLGEQSPPVSPAAGT